MARFAGIFSLIAVLLIQTLSTSLIVTTFEINRDTITDLFCVNKDQPEMHCEGECFLEKQIRADRKSHENTPKTTPEFFSLIFTLSENTILTPALLRVKTEQHFNYLQKEYQEFPPAIFHPPKFLV